MKPKLWPVLGREVTQHRPEGLLPARNQTGRTSRASQASDAGSIPIVRSRNERFTQRLHFSFFPNPRESLPFFLRNLGRAFPVESRSRCKQASLVKLIRRGSPALTSSLRRHGSARGPRSASPRRSRRERRTPSSSSRLNPECSTCRQKE